MKTLRKLGLLSIPLAFLMAGIGVLWLLNVKNAPGSFFERIANNKDDWMGAHVVLLFSTVFLLPAAISIRRAVTHKIVGAVANILVVIVGLTSVLLAGQYALDFVMPLLSDAGGDALKVHQLLFESTLIKVLFYDLPNLAILSLFLLTCTMFWSDKMPLKFNLILMINWLFVLTGNLMDPLVQRIAILCLAFSFLPLVRVLWEDEK